MQKILGLIADIVFTLAHPSHWIRLRSTNKCLDEFILEALKNPKFEPCGKYSIVLNGKRLWIENYPYSFGHIYKSPDIMGMPSRRTVTKLKKAIQTNWIKTIEGKAIG